MYILIINPIAGNGRAKKIFQRIQATPLYKEKDCRSFFTKYEGHGEEIASHVSQLYDDKIKCIIIVGGDGTVHEVMNGLNQKPAIPIALIPAGSGNDFARACQLPKDPIQLFKAIILRPNFSPYWLGVYQTDKRKVHQSKRFISNIGFGFDALVAKQANESSYKAILNRLKLGSLCYVIALLQVLRKFQPQTVNLLVDGKTMIYEDVWMVTVTNHPYLGGGMKIVPDAKINSKHCYLFIVHGISKLKLLALFATVFFGKHTNLKEVTILPASQIELSTESSIYYHADGNTNKCHRALIKKDDKARQIFRFKR